MNQELTVSALAARVQGEIVGDGATQILRVAELNSATAEEIAFVEDARFFAAAQTSQASCLIVPENAEIEFAGTLIRVKNPKLAFAKIAALLHPPQFRAGLDQTASIAATAEVGAGVFIGAFACVGANSRIGAKTQIHSGAKIGDNVIVGSGCLIYSNVVLYDNVRIGNNVVVHAGTVIGADGFGYVRGGAQEEYFKFPQIGMVVIEDNVEIGANSCVDRAALGETRIGRGTKIDNLVQIAHNVLIGERVIIASQTGISGSTVIESDAVIGGQVGMGDHAKILSGAVIGSKAGVLPGKIVRPGVWWGIPVQPLGEYKRQNAHVKALPRLREEVKELHRRLAEIEKILLPQNSAETKIDN